MVTAFILIALILATARLTRLITIDKIGDWIRNRVAMRFGDRSKLTYLFFCPWCMSVWVAAVLTPATWFATGLQDGIPVTAWWAIPAIALAVSQTVGLLRAIESD